MTDGALLYTTRPPKSIRNRKNTLPSYTRKREKICSLGLYAPWVLAHSSVNTWCSFSDSISCEIQSFAIKGITSKEQTTIHLYLLVWRFVLIRPKFYNRGDHHWLWILMLRDSVLLLDKLTLRIWISNSNSSSSLSLCLKQSGLVIYIVFDVARLRDIASDIFIIYWWNRKIPINIGKYGDILLVNAN